MASTAGLRKKGGVTRVPSRHYGCGLHAGPSPTGPARRRTLYLQHYNPAAFDLIGPMQGYNQIMPGYGEGDIPNIEEVQARNASN